MASLKTLTAGALALAFGAIGTANLAGAAEQIGDVKFQTSCAKAVQGDFNRAMALLHSFWFNEAGKAFDGVLAADPKCAMAQWGLALTALGNPLGGGPAPKDLAQGAAAVEKAKAIGAATQRERDYIAAIAAYFDDYQNRPHGVRALAYETEMAKIAGAYPDDKEAAVFYALALNMTVQPGDKTYANQLKAAALLEKAFAEQPNHPGVAHYLIHSYDYPPIAMRGLPAARRYAAIAPSAPHAQHMPSHVFTRLGHWRESAASNRASAEIARKEAAAAGPAVAVINVLHALDYMAYAYLQLGEDANAKAVLDEVRAVDKVDGAGLGAGYALAAIPARYALEREDWRAAQGLTAQPASFPWEKLPQAEAIVHFARGVGAAKLGDVAAAKASIARLNELHAALRATRQDYWAEQVAIQERAVSALASFALGQRALALAAMKEAAARESASEKHIVSPGPILPARELYGAMLLEMGQFEAALKELETSQRHEPNRLAGLALAAKAADKAGQPAKARAFYQQVLVLTSNADPGKRQAAEAKAYLQAQ
jgi:hypothetical protein